MRPLDKPIFSKNLTDLKDYNGDDESFENDAEMEAVLRLIAEITKQYVKNSDIVDFNDIGTQSPSF